MQPPDDRVSALLASAGLRGPFELHALSGGTNNRVFRVEVAGRRALLKSYFHDTTRDRLGNEFTFLRFAWDRGIRCVPEPLAADTEARLGLYEFVDAPPYAAGHVGERDVEAALAFVERLHAHRGDAAAAEMPAASDSCACGSDYLRSVDRRLQRLLGMRAADGVEEEASRFVHGELVPAWAEAQIVFAEEARRIGWDVAAPLPRSAQCLSPSDFGFHNALASPAGPRFIDFEYAGWDDPAKLVCDFFGQFEVPVPAAFFGAFAERFAALFDDAAFVRARMDVVLPACRFKWLCIILNDFDPVVRERRSFAHAGTALEERAACQLRKARAALRALVTPAPSL